MKIESKRVIVIVFSIITILVSIANLARTILPEISIPQSEIFNNILQESEIAGIDITDNEIETEEIDIGGIRTISTTGQIVSYSVLLITSIVILTLGIKDVKKYKVQIILLSMMQLIMGNIIYATIIIIILFKKTKNENGEIEADIEVPTIEREPKKSTLFYLFLFILAFIINYTPLTTWLIDMLTENIYGLPLVMLIGMSSLLCIIYPIVCMRREIKGDFKVFKENFKAYMEYIVPKLGVFLIVYYIVSVTLSLIIKEAPTNQASVEQLELWKLIPLGLIYAPVVEECLFRGLLKKGFKNDKLFVIISSAVFGILHVMFLETNLMLYLYSIIYIMVGYFLAKTYAKTDNIVASIFTHFMWNMISLLSTLLILF